MDHNEDLGSTADSSAPDILPAVNPPTDGLNEDLPPGNHPLEVAARKGFGPLSPLAKESWHGQGTPCVSCGQLVRRDQTQCDECGQDLSLDMLDKMRTNAGPWYVLEHVRPFPGVKLDLIVRQIRRGVLTETSIVRGPPTDFQWRFAIETPGLCRYFGRCWKCHRPIPATEGTCPSCHTYLTFEPPRPKSVTSTPRQPDQLDELSSALEEGNVPAREQIWDEPPRIAGFSATWVIFGLIVVVIVCLMIFTQWRSNNGTLPSSSTPGVILHVTADPYADL
ncbi:MAG: hypothetical protein KJ749_06260 [Planctomycetes bacterium]|nr:hypothetical protein [Planctomycetota bacterium]